MRIGRYLLVSLASVAACSEWPALTHAGTRGNKIEVQQFEMAYSPGKAGVRIRLTLATGLVVEYRVEDQAELETVGRLGSMFVSGGARMFADVDGKAVLGVQIAGPSGYRPGR